MKLRTDELIRLLEYTRCEAVKHDTTIENLSQTVEILRKENKEMKAYISDMTAEKKEG